MTFSGPSLRNQLLRTESYVGRPGWTSTAGWKPEGRGNTLFENRVPEDDSPPAPAIGILIGQVSDDRLFVSPTGTHSTYSPLAKAKFQFTLEQPLDPDLRLDWDTTVRNLEHMQNAVASTTDKQNMIVSSGTARSLRITAPVFEEKDPGAPQPGDDDIHMWPVPRQHEEALHALFDTHRVLPLIVYDVDELSVPPQQLPSKLRGALVEVHCRFRHYFINPKNAAEKNLDSFSAVVEQIIIRRKAAPKNPSPYRQNFNRGKGPLKLSSARGPSHSEQLVAAETFLPVDGTTGALNAQSSTYTSNPSTPIPHATAPPSPSTGSTLSGEGPEDADDGTGKRKADEILQSPTKKRTTRGARPGTT
ncbi:hypothetical protein FPV67DRAFT_1695825 [Lyophyllum atratum]|nr:hypothetical protein FPV67DRAFT_1695825 [Lyophyllum atratum]